MRSSFFVSSLLVLATNARPSHRHLSRMISQQGLTSDSCLLVDHDLLKKHLVDGADVLLNDQDTSEFSFCKSSLNKFLRFNPQGTKVSKALEGNTQAANILTQLIDNSQSGSVTCNYPSNSHPACSVTDVCAFECNAPYTSQDSQCVCPPTNDKCSAACVRSEVGCSSEIASGITSLSAAQNTCETGQTVCGVQSDEFDFACIDDQTDTQNCGGCVFASPFDLNAPLKGKDCSAGPGVSDVTCVDGACAVSACTEGYVLSSDQSSCSSSSDTVTNTDIISLISRILRTALAIIIPSDDSSTFSQSSSSSYSPDDFVAKLFDLGTALSAAQLLDQTNTLLKLVKLFPSSDSTSQLMTLLESLQLACESSQTASSPLDLSSISSLLLDVLESRILASALNIYSEMLSAADSSECSNISPLLMSLLKEVYQLVSSSSDMNTLSDNSDAVMTSLDALTEGLASCTGIDTSPIMGCMASMRRILGHIRSLRQTATAPAPNPSQEEPPTEPSGEQLTPASAEEQEVGEEEAEPTQTASSENTGRSSYLRQLAVLLDSYNNAGLGYGLGHASPQNGLGIPSMQSTARFDPSTVPSPLDFSFSRLSTLSVYMQHVLTAANTLAESCTCHPNNSNEGTSVSSTDGDSEETGLIKSIVTAVNDFVEKYQLMEQAPTHDDLVSATQNLLASATFLKDLLSQGSQMTQMASAEAMSVPLSRVMSLSKEFLSDVEECACKIPAASMGAVSQALQSQSITLQSIQM